MLSPLLTELDPLAKSEGSIDPLGMYPIADVLAMRLAPGVRERQAHPRFLTATAVSLAVCSKFDEDVIAKDGESEPWQVFEWYVVEGFVRQIRDSDRLRGLPGVEKARSAVRDGVPLSAKRYLKTPRVFGFHGVYRTLSRTLGIETAGRLGETGYELLEMWAKEQGVIGFYDSSAGPGAEWRRRLVEAVQDGLKQGSVARSNTWSGWDFLANHLAHLRIGKKEAQVIARALLKDAEGHRREVLEFLISRAGQRALGEDAHFSERAFHEALRERSGPGLAMLLEAIDTYEQFARLLQDAFDDCLYTMSLAKGRRKVTELSEAPSVKRAAEEIPSLFEKLIEILSPFGQSQRFQEVFEALSHRVPADEWLARLLDHHQRVQRRKPPQGKAPWIEQFDDGTFMVRPAYARESGGLHKNEYVHAYRTGPLWSFAHDLGMVP